MMLRKRLYIIVLVLALVIPVTVVYAYTPLDSVILVDDSDTENGPVDAHQVDLVSIEEYVENGVTYYTYTYAVTGLNNVQNAVSHFVLGIDTCYGEEFLVSPTHGSTYNTPIAPEIAVCETDYNCQPATYGVETGHDGSTGLTGLKYNITGQEGLKNGETHIFQITVTGILGDEAVGVLTKYGGTDTGGDETITGPVCPGPTAVTLSSSAVTSPATGALLPLVLIMGLALAATSIIVWRKQATAE